jgi:hypothetical protein
MSFWDLLNFNKAIERKIANAIALDKKPTISSQKELEVYLKCKVGDAEFAKIFAQALEKCGRNGTIEIKKGGDGSPYKLEYVSPGLRKTMKKKEIKKRMSEITEIFEKDNSSSKDEIEKLQNELSQLVDYHAIIWVNSTAQEDFSEKEHLFAEAIHVMQGLFS